MNKQKIAKPPPIALEEDHSFGTTLHGTCKNCIQGIECEYIRGIWKHNDHNLYNCKKAEPLSRYSGQEQYRCKMHNFQPSKYSDAMICTKCHATESKKDFLSNRNTYFCRIHNMKFANIEYHKKHFHNNGKVVMDYIDYSPLCKEIEESGNKLKGSRPRLQDDECHSWGESNFRIKPRDRLEIEWVARGMTKKAFIKTIVASNLSDGSYSWINERTGKSSNEDDVFLAQENYGKVLALDRWGKFKNQTDRIIKILDQVKDK